MEVMINTYDKILPIKTMFWKLAHAGQNAHAMLIKKSLNIKFYFSMWKFLDGIPHYFSSLYLYFIFYYNNYLLILLSEK